MGRVKINFFDVLDKYEYWKGKCVKSVLGAFSSGVSICRKKGTRSDLGASFLFGVPRPGDTEGPSSGSEYHIITRYLMDSVHSSFACLSACLIVIRSDYLKKSSLRTTGLAPVLPFWSFWNQIWFILQSLIYFLRFGS